MSVCPPVRPSVHIELLGSYLTDFGENLYLEFQLKFSENHTNIKDILHKNLRSFVTTLVTNFTKVTVDSNR
jgi:hypothetical protein